MPLKRETEICGGSEGGWPADETICFISFSLSNGGRKKGLFALAGSWSAGAGAENRTQALHCGLGKHQSGQTLAAAVAYVVSELWVVREVVGWASVPFVRLWALMGSRTLEYGVFPLFMRSDLPGVHSSQALGHWAPSSFPGEKESELPILCPLPHLGQVICFCDTRREVGRSRLANGAAPVGKGGRS